MVWKKINRVLLYAGLMALTLISLYLLDTRWSTVMDTQEVVIAGRQIMPHESIEDRDLQIVRIKKEFVIPGALSPDQIPALMDQEALQLIEQGDQLTLNRVDKQSLLKSPDLRIVEIPEKWILSVPGSLRRLDAVSIYAIRTEEVTSRSPDQVETGGNGERDQQETVAQLPEQAHKILEDITVAYYKDGGVNEVRSAISEQSNPNIRDVATVRGRRLELQLNDTQLQQLSALVDQGYQFIIGYGGGEE
jgi:hypothetical protein